MLGAGVCMAAMHVLIRHVSNDIHPFEIAFFRNLFALFAMVPWFVSWVGRRYALHGQGSCCGELSSIQRA